MKMKICAICGKEFPQRVYINEKAYNLQGRKNCLECSPFKDRTKSKQYNNRMSEEERKIKRYTADTIRRRKMKLKSIEYMGGKCCICGYDKCPGALDFHHKDSDDKKDGIGSMLSMSWEKIKEELDKCILVCANCHREIHYDTSKYIE